MNKMKYYILTMGCQLNENDSEKIAGMVEELGFDHVLILQDSSGKVYSYGPSDSGDVIAESLQDYLFPGSGLEETK